MRVVPAASGRKLDVEATSERLLAAALSRTTRTAGVVVETAQPERSTSEARAMGISRLVTAYTTTYGGEPNRLHNVRLVAQLIDGALIAPGAEFSFNRTTGERTAEKGFREAPVIINGELQTGLGGGVCQVSTTVFNAAYEAGLPIAERTNHALYIDHYPLGRDATVNYPDLDLRFRNDTSRWMLVRTWVGWGWTSQQHAYNSAVTRSLTTRCPCSSCPAAPAPTTTPAQRLPRDALGVAQVGARTSVGGSCAARRGSSTAAAVSTASAARRRVAAPATTRSWVSLCLQRRLARRTLVTELRVAELVEGGNEMRRPVFAAVAIAALSVGVGLAASRSTQEPRAACRTRWQRRSCSPIGFGNALRCGGTLVHVREALSAAMSDDDAGTGRAVAEPSPHRASPIALRLIAPSFEGFRVRRTLEEGDGRCGRPRDRAVGPHVDAHAGEHERMSRSTELP